jgi:hypothetical protein
VQLSKETGVRQQTLPLWLQEARSLPPMASNNPRSQAWSVEQKARVLAEASKLSGEQLNAYLQREGVQLADFERRRIALEDGSGSLGAARRIRQLERELARKEKEWERTASRTRVQKELRTR